MKHIYFLFLCIFGLSLSVNAQTTLPLTFEGDVSNIVFEGFEGAASQIIANPDASGDNTSGTVMETIKTDGAQFFAGTVITLDEAIDFSESTSISISTWSPKADIPVRLKLETANPDVFVELDVNTTVASEWETLTWEFNNVDPDLDYVKVIVFFEFIVDLPGDGTTYYYDNVEVAEGGGMTGGDVTLPLTFEDETLNYNFIGFEGAASQIIDNPDASGDNTSGRVMETIKTDGAQFFAGTAVNLDEPIDFSESFLITMSSWSPKGDIPVRMRLENANNSIGTELDVNTVATSSWETMTWDFAGLVDPNVDYVRVVVFYEFIADLQGDGTTYYFDNIQVADDGVVNGDVELPLTFEDEDLIYSFIGFEGAASQLIDNPDASGENTSETVMETIKTDGAQFFAGTAVSLDQPIDFSTSNVITMSSWSPKGDIPVRMRLEDGPNTVGIELDANTVATSSWETLSWDFTDLIDPNVDYVRVVVFYEFIEDLAGDGTTYYFDNVTVDGLSSTTELAAISAVAYPNPTTDQWIISSQDDEIQSVRVFNVLGKEVYSATPATNTITIAAQQLPIGTYLAEVRTAAGRGVVRLVKQ